MLSISHALFFGTFDAVVLMASVLILFPADNRDLAGLAMRHFTWTIERFRAISHANRLARAAMGVLRAIEARLHSALGRVGLGTPRHDHGGNSSDIVMGKRTVAAVLPYIASPPRRSPAPAATGSSNQANSHDEDHLTPASPAKCPTGKTPPGLSSFFPNSTLAGHGDAATIFPHSSDTTPSSVGAGMIAAIDTNTASMMPGFHVSIEPTEGNYKESVGSGPVQFPREDFDWASLQPIYAVSDLLYNDLVGSSLGEAGNNNTMRFRGDGSSNTLDGWTGPTIGRRTRWTVDIGSCSSSSSNGNSHGSSLTAILAITACGVY